MTQQPTPTGPATPSDTEALRFDHDGTWRHHHDVDTQEPIWWTGVDHFGGEKREHRHWHRGAPAAPPDEAAMMLFYTSPAPLDESGHPKVTFWSELTEDERDHWRAHARPEGPAAPVAREEPTASDYPAEGPVPTSVQNAWNEAPER